MPTVCRVFIFVFGVLSPFGECFCCSSTPTIRVRMIHACATWHARGFGECVQEDPTLSNRSKANSAFNPFCLLFSLLSFAYFRSLDFSCFVFSFLSLFFFISVFVLSSCVCALLYLFHSYTLKPFGVTFYCSLKIRLRSSSTPEKFESRPPYSPVYLPHVSSFRSPGCTDSSCRRTWPRSLQAASQRAASPSCRRPGTLET